MLILFLLQSLAHATCMPLMEPVETTYQLVDASCRPVTSVVRGETALAIIVPRATGWCSAPGGPMYLYYETGPDLTVYDADDAPQAVEVVRRHDVTCPVEGVPNPYVVSFETSTLKPGQYRVDQAAFTVLPRRSRE